MSVDITTARRYRTRFRSDESLKLGRDTDVEVSRLDVETGPTVTGNEARTPLTITATIKLTAKVTAASLASDHCHICDSMPPLPSTYDALWYVLENHEGERLVFPAVDDDKDKRDAYIVPGWRRIDDQLTCASCAEELEVAKTEVRKCVLAKRRAMVDVERKRR